MELKEVTAVFVREIDHINYLTVIDESGEEQVLAATDSHPFWVVTDEPDLERAASGNADGMYHENIDPGLNGFWVEAKDLREGDVFIGVNGELSTLVSKERVEFAEPITVYNFTVEGNHNYFVIAVEDENGQTSVLVHNVGPVIYDLYGRFPREKPSEQAKRIIENHIARELGKLGLSLDDPLGLRMKLGTLEGIIINAVQDAILNGVSEQAILMALYSKHEKDKPDLAAHLLALRGLRPSGGTDVIEPSDILSAAQKGINNRAQSLGMLNQGIAETQGALHDSLTAAQKATLLRDIYTNPRYGLVVRTPTAPRPPRQ